MILILALLFVYVNAEQCVSPIYKIEPPICSNNNIGILGIKVALQYGKLLFADNDIVFNKEQLNCVINGSSSINTDIRYCIRDLTINNNTKPEKVARGLALNKYGEWVSACAENMPCVEFNNFVQNSTFRDLIRSCGAEEKFNTVLETTDIILSSWYGFEYCQKLYPKKCLYKESEICSENKIYACPVSRWIYASNFMLLYMLDPYISKDMPNCRIV